MSLFSNLVGGSSTAAGAAQVPAGGIVTMLSGTNLADTISDSTGAALVKCGSVQPYNADYAALVSNGQATFLNQTVNGHGLSYDIRPTMVYNPAVDYNEVWQYDFKRRILNGPKTAGKIDTVQKASLASIPADMIVGRATYNYEFDCYFAAAHKVNSMLYDGGQYTASIKWCIYTSTDGVNWVEIYQTYVPYIQVGGFYATIYFKAEVMAVSRTDMVVKITNVDSQARTVPELFVFTLTGWTPATMLFTPTSLWTGGSTASYDAYSTCFVTSLMAPHPNGIYFVYGWYWSGNGSTTVSICNVSNGTYQLRSMSSGSTGHTVPYSCNAIYFKGKYFWQGYAPASNRAVFSIASTVDTTAYTEIADVTNSNMVFNYELGRLEYYDTTSTAKYTTDGITWNTAANGIPAGGTSMVGSNISGEYSIQGTRTNDGMVTNGQVYGAHSSLTGGTATSNVVYWNSRYWAAANSVLASSPDMLSWKIESALNGTAAGLAFQLKVVNNLLFILDSSSGGVLQWFNGTSPLQYITPNVKPGSINDIEYIGGRYVIVGNATSNINAAYNTTLVATGWTATTTAIFSTTTPVYGITSSGSALVAWTSNAATGTLAYSTDGITWTTSATAVPYFLMGVTWHSNVSKFYCVTQPVNMSTADYTSFKIWESTNGVAWTTTATVTGVNTIAYAKVHNTLQYSSSTGKYYLMGQNRNIMSSTNLTTWTVMPLISPQPITQTVPFKHDRVTVANGKVLFVTGFLEFTEIDTSTGYVAINAAPVTSGTVNYVRYK